MLLEFELAITAVAAQHFIAQSAGAEEYTNCTSAEG